MELFFFSPQQVCLFSSHLFNMYKVKIKQYMVQCAEAEFEIF